MNEYDRNETLEKAYKTDGILIANSSVNIIELELFKYNCVIIFDNFSLNNHFIYNENINEYTQVLYHILLLDKNI